MSGLVFLSSTTKQGLMCLAQGLNTVTPMRLKSETPRSWDKNPSTKPTRAALTRNLLFSKRTFIDAHPYKTCADPGIFVRGVQVNLIKKASFFLFISLFYCQMVNFKENYHFSRYQRGSNIFQGGGGSNFFQGGGGSNCLFPIETHITCDFPGGRPDPLSPPPLDPHL